MSEQKTTKTDSLIPTILKKHQKESSLEDIEIALLLEGIYLHYGFDFRNYALSSLKRRIKLLMEMEKILTISELQNQILHQADCMERLLLQLSINVTSMFRDPNVYLSFRKKVVPILKTYPFIRIWHAGCATGEEVYSMAILLQEEGLWKKTKIYATDMNEVVLQKAKAGIFKLNLMKEFTDNYIKSRGKNDFSTYYTAKYDNAIFRKELKENIIFSKHNLVTDHSFNEFHIIFCRNVLIYFDDILQNKVHDLFYESLCRFGILVVGKQESLRFTSHEDDYKIIDEDNKIYRRRK